MNQSSGIEAKFWITVALPYYLRLPNANYQCRYGKNEYMLCTQAQSRSLGESEEESQNEEEDTSTVLFKPFTGELTRAMSAHVPGAMLRYTQVTIHFCRIIDESKVSSFDVNPIRDQAHTILNHFLDLYRFIAQDKEVRPLTKAELHQVRDGRALCISIQVEHEGKGTLRSGVVFDESDPMVFGPPALLLPEKLQELRDRLVASQTPEVSSLLLLGAESYIVSGEYRLAMIDMHSALDIVAERTAYRILRYQGVSESEAQKKLERAVTSKIVDTIIMPLVANEHRGDSPWEEWKLVCRPLRNRVVHDGYAPTREETTKSYDVVKAICVFLSSLEHITV